MEMLIIFFDIVLSFLLVIQNCAFILRDVRDFLRKMFLIGLESFGLPLNNQKHFDFF